ncbi:MAG TPA: hypothetical protein VN231_12905 [Allosphingosinicella sp.]|nr:hypothetical protein [Allosphingosinicella sp.]
MTQTPRYVSVEDLGEVLAIALTEVVAAVSANSKEADERLEVVANHLLDAVEGLVEGTPRMALRSLAHALIQTEGGAV